MDDVNWKRFHHGLVEAHELIPEDRKSGSLEEEHGITNDLASEAPRVEPHVMAVHSSIHEGGKYFVAPWQSIQEEMEKGGREQGSNDRLRRCKRHH